MRELDLSDSEHMSTRVLRCTLSPINRCARFWSIRASIRASRRVVSPIRRQPANHQSSPSITFASSKLWSSSPRKQVHFSNGENYWRKQKRQWRLLLNSMKRVEQTVRLTWLIREIWTWSAWKALMPLLMRGSILPMVKVYIRLTDQKQHTAVCTSKRMHILLVKVYFL